MTSFGRREVPRRARVSGGVQPSVVRFARVVRANPTPRGQSLSAGLILIGR